LALLPTSSRSSAAIHYLQYDALSALKNDAEKEIVKESHRHPITRKLETCPGMGPIRVARFASVVVSPHRFRGRRQLWSYFGLAVVMPTSSDWEQQADRSWEKVRKPQTRGLNWNFNRMLKDVFKGAAVTVIEQGGEEPLYQEYQRQIQGGTKPNLARVTLARERKIAAVSLSMWKREEEYDAKRRQRSLT
jgi:transposase